MFSEQGTSSSHLCAAKIVDAIGRMPGMSGGNADATGAYTQTVLGDDCPETWISIPRDRWPKHWHGKYTDPVIRLRLNLYGHPLAGLIWEKHGRRALLKCGFEPVSGWDPAVPYAAWVPVQ